MTVNELAAEWWAVRFQVNDQRDRFRLALLNVLPESDWETYNDYDPDDFLLRAVRAIGIPCAGWGEVRGRRRERE